MNYARENIQRMAGYAYGEQPTDPDVVKLNTNENPYPPSPAVSAALANFDAASLRRYPPATADGLRDRIATHFSLNREQVVVTNGGDEGLRLAMTTFAGPGERIGMAAPSYSLFPVLAQVQDCAIAEVPLEDDWHLPESFARQVNDAGAKLTYLVNPHAPSGTLTTAADIAALASELDGLLLVDEAYVDFVDPALDHDLTPLLASHENLLLLRTFSKGYSLAGLRVGFLLGNRDLIEPMLTKTRDSFNVDAIAQSVAIATLGDYGHAAQCWRKIRETRRELTDALRELGFGVADSQANFVLAQMPDGTSAAPLHRELRKLKVLVRHFDTPRLRDSLRITVGTPDEVHALLAALDRLCDGSR